MTFHFNLAAAYRDLKAFLGTRQRHQLLFAALAIAMPALLVAGFYVDSSPAPPPLGIIYVESWPLTRTDDEIKAQQKVDQAAKDKALAERRAQYQRLEKQLGMK